MTDLTPIADPARRCQEILAGADCKLLGHRVELTCSTEGLEERFIALTAVLPTFNRMATVVIERANAGIPWIVRASIKGILPRLINADINSAKIGD